MKAKFLLESDIEIPNHLYSEAAELFLNHLRTHFEAQRSKDDSLVLHFSLELSQTKSTQSFPPVPIDFRGASCPVYYKKRKGIYSDEAVHRSRVLNTLQ